MKKVIAGQIMMWSNLIGVVIGYNLFLLTGIQSEYLSGLLGCLGAVGSGFNLFFSIALQFRGYREDNIMDITP